MDDDTCLELPLFSNQQSIWKDEEIKTEGIDFEIDHVDGEGSGNILSRPIAIPKTNYYLDLSDEGDWLIKDNLGNRYVTSLDKVSTARLIYDLNEAHTTLLGLLKKLL